ncbi:MAG TPA: alpha/beta hydrolase, partial [Deltaproteobacteria bacterium]|nr:alpha/beta hydrolase [Deltaproteobacteria bacterium]
IKSPTLIIWGRHDKSFPVDHAYYGHERIKNSLVYIVEESGHLPNFEKPEEFNRIVLDFLYKE